MAAKISEIYDQIEEASSKVAGCLRYGYNGSKH